MAESQHHHQQHDTCFLRGAHRSDYLRESRVQSRALLWPGHGYLILYTPTSSSKAKGQNFSCLHCTSQTQYLPDIINSHKPLLLYPVKLVKLRLWAEWLHCFKWKSRNHPRCIKINSFALISQQLKGFHSYQISVTDHPNYRKVASTSPSCLEAHAGFFRLSIKGKFDVYLP